MTDKKLEQAKEIIADMVEFFYTELGWAKFRQEFASKTVEQKTAARQNAQILTLF